MYGETYEFNVTASTGTVQGPVSGTTVTTESGTCLLFFEFESFGFLHFSYTVVIWKSSLR